MFSKVEFIPSIYYPILYRYLKNPQIKHWNKSYFSFSQMKIQEIENAIGKEKMNLTLISNFHILSGAYESLLDLEERIMLMNRFKGNEELKVKVFSINIYNDLLNISFGELLKLFIEFESVRDGKNLVQSTLTPQIELLSTPRRGYKELTDLVDSNIRNAVSYGGAKVSGPEIIFSYRKGKQYLEYKTTVYGFKDSLLQLFDGVSATILVWFGYLCKENITCNEVFRNESAHKGTIFFFEKLSISTLLTTCDKISQLDINNDTGQRQHVSVDFMGVDLDISIEVVSRNIHSRKGISIKEAYNRGYYINCF